MLVAFRENLFDVLPTIQYADDLGGVVHNPIEHHVGRGRERSEPGPQFTSVSPGKRMLLDGGNHFANLAGNLLGGDPAGSPFRVIPNVIEIGARFRRLDGRTSTFGHTMRTSRG